MDLLLIIPAMFLAWYDFRIRRIIIWQLLVFCMSCIGISFYSYGITETLWHIAWTILLLTYLGAGIEIYLLIRYRHFINSLKKHLGMGDVLFALATTPIFPPQEFILFLLASMIGGLLWWLAYGRKGLIPLVGVSGIVLGIFQIVS